jgi:hypothetical protein
VANGYSWVGGEDGRKELGTGEPGDGRLADFDVNVGDVELFKDLEAPKGRSVGVFTGERLGCHPDPKNDGGGGLSDHADANDVGACPLDPHLIQASVDLGSHVALPDGVELMVDDDPEQPELGVRLRALGLLPQIGASARQQAWGGMQSSVIIRGLHVGQRGRGRRRSAFRGGMTVDVR